MTIIDEPTPTVANSHDPIAHLSREDIEASPELTDHERTAVLGATAITLIPRLAALRTQAQTHAS